MAEMGRITAVLGPTNTGKTHYAIERMIAYPTGIIGLPLRLLAREVYDRIVKLRGPSVVALVTGEERIVPDRAAYWVCTVEAMPEGLGCDFVAIDEIQMCADLDRGHVFTDRLLHARGTHETLFMGADTMRSAISAMVPKAQFLSRERFSELTYTGEKKLSRMRPRSAVVSFSVENVYAIAELLKRQRGGAAVVMGALSPRTRNAQVELYQNGDVDFMVATDAIGMGLNLDVEHVAFSGTHKFDGRRMRPLMAGELGQIAGRAGRYRTNGTFGVTGEASPLHEEVVASIQEHRFAPVKKLQWRNSRLEFGSPERLIQSLEAPTSDPWLTRVRESDDLAALKALTSEAEVRARSTTGSSVRLLWDVCRVPDFRGISPTEHAGLLAQIFKYLHEAGQIPNDWFRRQVARIDRTEGDIDTLSKRLAFVRTWTYVAQRAGWVEDESHWRGETRAVEDRLSDALHTALTARFVDRRTSVLMRRLKQKERLLAEVNDQGEVTVEGHVVGKLEGFRFRQDESSSAGEAKTLRSAALQALAPKFHLMTDRFYNAPDTEIDFTEQGGLMWGDQAVGKLVQGSDPLKPQVKAFVDDEAGPELAEKVARRLQHFIDRKIAALFEPLIAMQRDEALTGLARGFAFQMVEAMGIMPRAAVADDVKNLDQDARGLLRKHGVRFGQFTIFLPLLLKPAPTRLRLVLMSLAKGVDVFPESPPPGLVSIPTDKDAEDWFHTAAGYRAAGERAIRIDMLERLADMIRTQDTRGGFEASADMLSITGMTLEQFADLMQGLGYRAERGEQVKPAKPAPVVEDADAGIPQPPAPPPTPPAPPPSEVPGETPGDAPGEVPPPPPADLPPDAPKPPAEAALPVPETGPETGPETAPTEAPTAEPAEADAAPEMEVFFTFTWGGGRPRGARPDGAKPRGKGGKPQGRGKGPAKGKGGKPQARGPKTYEAKPQKKDKIDPDNPFAAALMGLKGKE
ncbi:MAG: helicase-related protein [Pseudomonadota bacterium]